MNINNLEPDDDLLNDDFHDSFWVPRKRWRKILVHKKTGYLIITVVIIVLAVIVSQQLNIDPDFENYKLNKTLEVLILLICGGAFGVVLDKWTELITAGDEDYVEANRIKDEVDDLVSNHRSLWDVVRTTLETREERDENHIAGILFVLRMNGIQFKTRMNEYAAELEKIGYDPSEFFQERIAYLKKTMEAIRKFIVFLREDAPTDTHSASRDRLLAERPGNNGRLLETTQSHSNSASAEPTQDESGTRLNS